MLTSYTSLVRLLSTDTAYTVTSSRETYTPTGTENDEFGFRGGVGGVGSGLLVQPRCRRVALVHVDDANAQRAQ
jgi:hypothetical protein